jgi:ABC-2 type transport system ATP-binding protein
MRALDHNATATSDIVVELSGVHKTFYQKQRSERLSEALRNMLRPPIREVQALRDVNLRIERGEIVAYAGPNGAGKSTTVKLLSGLLTPDRGTVRALGMDPVRERVRYVRSIGVVFGQRTELWNDHPIAASFEWKRVVWDIPRARYERMKGLVIEVLGLGEFFNSLTRELSLGQKMRAELGLALLHEPEILFLDEPTIGLDVLAKRLILDFIKQLNREQRVTVMITSHDMAELEQLAGRMVMIDRGSIAFDGSFDRLRREVADRRRLIVETPSEAAPALHGATLLGSEAGRHEYVFDAAQTRIAALLDQAGAQTQILDVETHRAPIDEVIADIYRSWQR